LSIINAVTFTNNLDANISVGVLLTQLVTRLNDHTRLSFVTLYKPVHIGAATTSTAIYFVVILDGLMLSGSILFLLVNIFRYCKTIIRVRILRKNKREKVTFWTPTL
jgi:hypothetical protein